MISLRAIADAWISAWNGHDLEAIMEHCTDDVVFRADTVIARWQRLRRPGAMLGP